VQDTQVPIEVPTTTYVLPESDCNLDTFAVTLASLTTEQQIKDYVNAFLVVFSMKCLTSEYGPGIKEIKRLQKARLREIN
tara:strand:+ start:1036 stop:1275 length:240 start_codon:yes stop_codon:yes gene_type:complete